MKHTVKITKIPSNRFYITVLIENPFLSDSVLKLKNGNFLKIVFICTALTVVHYNRSHQAELHEIRLLYII